MKIFKYRLDIQDTQCIKMPKKATILSAGCQNGDLMIWAMVNEKLSDEERFLHVIGTGNPISIGIGRFVGTVIMNGHQAGFVWHVFEGA